YMFKKTYLQKLFHRIKKQPFYSYGHGTEEKRHFLIFFHGSILGWLTQDPKLQVEENREDAAQEYK
ncbi:hypothetical protein CEXT_733891, partial [Caerostris extrusa]